jgi:hypothetical protein
LADLFNFFSGLLTYFSSYDGNTKNSIKVGDFFYFKDWQISFSGQPAGKRHMQEIRNKTGAEQNFTLLSRSLERHFSFSDPFLSDSG